jgi:riboflavin kinase/FMN adenylyltransferase
MSTIIQVHQCCKKFQSLPLVIGFFDGLHRGHSTLFKEVSKGKFNILTFTNIPSKKNNFIYNDESRLSILKNTGAQNIFILDLNNNNMDMSQFINFLKNVIDPKYICVGSNFRFGKDRFGNVKELKRHFETVIVNLNSKYSTSNIKKLLTKGKIQQVNKMLLEPFHILGKVVKGKQYGRVLGFKTANVYADDRLLKIKPGQYAGYVLLKQHKYPAAVFVQPNKKNEKQLIEAHILNGFNSEIYNQIISIELLQFIQSKQKTDSFESLQSVIGKGVKRISTILKV